MAFCKFCGAEIKDNDKFCTKCGKKTDNVKSLVVDKKILDNVLSSLDKNTFKLMGKIIALVIIIVFLTFITQFILSNVIYPYEVGFVRKSKTVIVKSLITIILAVFVGYKNEYNFKKTFCAMLICFLSTVLKFCFFTVDYGVFGGFTFVDTMLIILYSAVCKKDNVNKYIYVLLPSVFFVFLNYMLPYLVFGEPLSWDSILSLPITLTSMGILYYYIKTVLRLNVIKSVLFNVFIFFLGYVLSFFLVFLLLNFVDKYVIIDGNYINRKLLQYCWLIISEIMVLIITYTFNKLTNREIRK